MLRVGPAQLHPDRVGGPQPEQVQQGMNILLKGALGTGKKTVARAICNILKRPMFDIRANDIPYLADVRAWAAKVASLAIQWNAVVVVDRGDHFIKSQSPTHQERINTVIQEFESPGCICLWPSVFTGEHPLIRPFSATINFPDLDRAARRQRWLQLFGRDDLASTLSSSEQDAQLIRGGATPSLLKPTVHSFVRARGSDKSPSDGIPALPRG